MASTTSKAPSNAAAASTMVRAFELTSESLADSVAIRTRDDEVTLTWAQWRERSGDIAAGLHRLGLRRGGTIALLLSNRPEFHLVDVAAVTLGATPFSIYQTYAPNQIQFVLGDADARIVVAERQFLDALREALDCSTRVESVIIVDPAPGETLPPGAIPLSELEASGRSEELRHAVAQAASEVEPEDLLTLIYTSGTTGPPKGVQLSHRNLMSAVCAIEQMVQFPPRSRVISWLPAAHIAERAAHHYLPIVYGMQITCCADPRQVIAYLPEVRPQWFFAVPRVWEKLKAGLQAMLAGMPEDQRVAAERALERSLQRVRLRQRGEPVPAELEQEVAVADERLFAGIRATLGFDQVKAVNAGGAPTPVEVLEFFHAIGIPVAELWGMSETCGAGSVNPPQKIKIGTVGPPAPGVEIALAEDGEVLVRGDVVMSGYRGSPAQTAEAIDHQGWLHTGDIGELDEDGYLRIIDRKKELIINAAGKNMSPANIEATIKTASSLIGQACVIGDRRPYNTALIVLDSDFAPAWAAQHGRGGLGLAELADHPAVREAIQQALDAANARLSRVEQIKRFTVVKGDWLAGGEELTPTMKLRRRSIAARYAGAIEAMYS